MVAYGSTKRAVKWLKEEKAAGSIKKEVKIKRARHFNALSKHHRRKG